jgi:hypothetical protein
VWSERAWPERGFEARSVADKMTMFRGGSLEVFPSELASAHRLYIMTGTVYIYR